MKLWNLDRLWRRLSSPRRWKVTTRKAFILALPLAIPLWMLAIIAFVAACLLRGLARPIISFWSDPPKERCYYRYRSRSNAQTVPQFANLLWPAEELSRAA